MSEESNGKFDKVHYAITKEDYINPVTDKIIKKNANLLHIFYRDRRSIPHLMSDATLTDKVFLLYKCMAFQQEVEKSILDGHG